MYLFLYLAYYYFLILSSLIYGLTTVRRHSPLSFRLLRWWLIVTVLIEGTVTVLARLHHNGNWVYNFWEPFDCCVVLLMFYHGMTHGVTRRICRWLVALVPVGFFIFILPSLVKLTQSIDGMLFYLFCELVGACLFLVDGLLPGEERSLFQQPFSWLAFGTILYTCMYILIHASMELTRTWNQNWYFLLSGVANSFQYASVWMTLYTFRKK